MSNLATAFRRYIQSVFFCFYLCCGGFFVRKNRSLLYSLCKHFGKEKDDDDPAPPRPFPHVPLARLEEVLGKDVDVTMTEVEAADGNVSPLELLVIASLVKKHRPKLCLEIGTFDGRTTLNIAMNQDPEGRVITLDLLSEDQDEAQLNLTHGDDKFINKESSGTRFAGHELGSRIEQVYGDSATYDFSGHQGSVDFMFIDGSHSYDYVLVDTKTAMSLVRPGGIIVWHDFDSPYWHGVTRALNEMHADDPAFSGLRRVSGTSLCVLEKK